jgi:hypothetical protein
MFRLKSRSALVIFALGLVALALLSACGGGAPAAPTTQAAASSTAIPATPTTQPSPTSVSTSTPEPSRTVQPTTTPIPTVTRKATSTPSASLSNVIQDAVIAAGVQDGSLAPLGTADTFSPDQGVYHAVVSIQDAPSGTNFKVVWTAVDTGGALAANHQLGDYTLTADGTKYLDFTYKPSGGKMPVGSFKVEIFVNGDLARTLDFTVSASAQVLNPATLTPAAAASCPSLTLPTDTPPSFPIGVTMAPATQGDKYDPVNPGRIFGPADTIHAVVNIQNAPDNTIFKAIWYADDTAGELPCNDKLQESALTTGGSNNIDFKVWYTPKWPIGEYRVEIYVNDVKALTTTFNVVANPPTAEASTAVPSPAASPSGAQAITYPAQVTYQHTARDCFLNDTGAAVTCNPPGLDIKSVTVTRPSADGPITIVLELASGQSVTTSSLWGMAYALDLDRNVSTGLQDVYPAQHGIGPELYLLYGQVNGEIKQQIKQYAADGTASDADASLAQWSWQDDTHLQVVIDPSLIPVERFNLVGDLTGQTMYDHFVEDGYLMFPEGQAGHK